MKNSDASTAESAKATFKKRSKIDWRNLAIDLGIEISRGLLVGASMSVGRIVVDKAFAPKVSNRNLTLIPGANHKVG